MLKIAVTSLCDYHKYDDLRTNHILYLAPPQVLFLLVIGDCKTTMYESQVGRWLYDKYSLECPHNCLLLIGLVTDLMFLMDSMFMFNPTRCNISNINLVCLRSNMVEANYFVVPTH